FVILNSFLMSLGERRRQFAILRALGASRGLVTRLLLREAMLYGITGTIIGLVCGWGLSLGLQGVMQALLGVQLPASRFSLPPFLFGLLLGPGMALAATYWPSRRAGRRIVLDDLLHKADGRSISERRWPSYVGLALLTPVLVLEIAFVRGWLPAAVSRALVPP